MPEPPCSHHRSKHLSRASLARPQGHQWSSLRRLLIPIQLADTWLLSRHQSPPKRRPSAQIHLKPSFETLSSFHTKTTAPAPNLPSSRPLDSFTNMSRLGNRAHSERSLHLATANMSSFLNLSHKLRKRSTPTESCGLNGRLLN